MKTVKNLLFPLLLTGTCCVVYFWQNSVASLPYLPFNCIVPLAILTPLLLVLTFLTTFVMLRQNETSKPVKKSIISTLGMFVPVVMTLVFYLSFVSYRFAGILPVIVLPNWPTGIVTAIIAAMCIIHLTGLLICRFIKQKFGAKQIVASSIGWAILNLCLFLATV
ncbi:MAG: hypothetical protein K6B52_04650 [Clostridiales bacterium]|nr:hypothetical protein [Clostridiales bacterium]